MQHRRPAGWATTEVHPDRRQLMLRLSWHGETMPVLLAQQTSAQDYVDLTKRYKSGRLTRAGAPVTTRL
ncbi:hypothetical protein CCHOA_11855 [Corynebacterium choanae]|uniref:Uncharacterized protein n=1 Tax=Corynebacterium choanae TaxID=1862358 RepID=A0A3G6JAA2_9CORY|nr:hypothetical protein CCHOA_11855 [Corynebacterium choanae]